MKSKTLGIRKGGPFSIRKKTALGKTKISIVRTSTLGKTKSSTLGKRKRSPISLRKRTSPTPKRIDVGNTGDITSVTKKYARFTMSKQLVSALRDVSYESSRNMIEYAGKIDISKLSNKSVKIMTPTKMTSMLRGQVVPSPGLLSTLVTYHSHPSPEPLGSNLTRFRNYHTLPSREDLTLYIKSYPRMQANIILDTNGYYIVDLVEGENHNLYDILKNFAYYDTWELGRYKKIIGGYYYYEVVPSDWKNTFVKNLDIVMRRVGVSIKYYTWSERGTITLTIKNA